MGDPGGYLAHVRDARGGRAATRRPGRRRRRRDAPRLRELRAGRHEPRSPSSSCRARPASGCSASPRQRGTRRRAGARGGLRGARAARTLVARGLAIVTAAVDGRDAPASSTSGIGFRQANLPAGLRSSPRPGLSDSSGLRPWLPVSGVARPAAPVAGRAEARRAAAVAGSGRSWLVRRRRAWRPPLIAVDLLARLLDPLAERAAEEGQRLGTAPHEHDDQDDDEDERRCPCARW